MIKPLRDRHLEPVTNLPRSLRRYESSYDASRQDGVMMREQTRCEIENKPNEWTNVLVSPSGIRFACYYRKATAKGIVLSGIEILSMPINAKAEGTDYIAI